VHGDSGTRAARPICPTRSSPPAISSYVLLRATQSLASSWPPFAHVV